MNDTALLPQDSASGFRVFNLRDAPVAADSGDGFLGILLGVSHHPGWNFWRSSGLGGEGRHLSGANHLVVILLEGTLILTCEGEETRLAAGDVALIGPGQIFAWKAGDQALWIVNARMVGSSQGAAQGITVVDRATGQEPSASPPADLLVGDVPVCTKLTLAASDDAGWSAGLWSATPYERVPVRYGYYELMQIHEGTVSVFDKAGRELTFGPGSVFLMPEGATAGWRSTTPVRKFWSIFTPD